MPGCCASRGVMAASPAGGGGGSSWPLAPDDEPLGEQRSGPPVRADLVLGARHLHRLARSADLLDGTDDPLEELGGVAGVTERHQTPVGGDRQRPARSDVAVGDERTALSVVAEPVRLELADDLEGERVVEL